MSWRPRCPRCGSRDAKACGELLQGSTRDEDVQATHECACGCRFRVDPPTEQCLQAYAPPRAGEEIR